MDKMELRNDFNFENILLVSFLNLTKEESEMIRQWRNDEKIRKWMYTDHIIEKDEHQSFLKKLERDSKNFSWLIKSNDTYLGVLNFNNINFKDKNTYFGFYVNPDIILPGVGVLIDRIAIKLAFNIIGLHTLKLEALEDNRVIELHKKLGFQEEGRLKEFILKDDIWKDVIIMGITNK